VIVRDGKVLGCGYHTWAGKPHAEREALADARRRGAELAGACAYVTLEPCNHTGKTPPCTEALIEAGIARVVVGSADPNPLVAGAGNARLRDAGIEVVELYEIEGEPSVAEICDELRDLNRGFFSRMTRGLPYTVAKYAMTLDGKIATRTGESKWITGEVARHRVHVERARTDAVVSGVGTVLADNPKFSARIDDFSRKLFLNEDDLSALMAVGIYADDAISKDTVGTPQPIRVVCDTHLRTPLDCALVQSAWEEYAGYKLRTIIATCEQDPVAAKAYLEQGCEVWCCNNNHADHVDVHEVLKRLASEGINNIVLEGGPTFLGAAFDVGIVDAVEAYIAPKIFGGEGAQSPLGGIGVACPADALKLQNVCVESLPPDYLIKGIAASA
jgi:diaminohydroxyphosphoribosylaminopyrimidine deaminase/5-amino-6-(5-phosphoribosylamino)uracil reductase